MVDNISQENKNIMNTKDYKVEFNYEFLDDYRDETFGRKFGRRFASYHVTEQLKLTKRDEFSDTASSVDDVASVQTEQKNKGFIAQWGPAVFSPKYHPLALMVRSCG